MHMLQPIAVCNLTAHTYPFPPLGADRSSTPHAMQWAIRANTQSRPSSSSLAAPQTTGGSGFIYVDSASLRRGGSNAAAASTGTSELPGTSVPHSMSSSASALARAFGIVVREVSTAIASLE